MSFLLSFNVNIFDKPGNNIMKKHSKKFICEAIAYWKKQLKKLDESSSSLSAVVSTTPMMVNAFGEYLADEYDAGDSNRIDFCLGLEWEKFKKEMQFWANESGDPFFTKRRCDRCGAPLTGGRIMSMFNTDTLCMKCADEERKRPDFRAARDAEERAIKSGDMNFKGIGLNEDDSNDNV